MIMEYKIEVRETADDPWRDCGEGPWASADEAMDFGMNEVGVDWRCLAEIFRKTQEQGQGQRTNP